MRFINFPIYNPGPPEFQGALKFPCQEISSTCLHVYQPITRAWSLCTFSHILQVAKSTIAQEWYYSRKPRFYTDQHFSNRAPWHPGLPSWFIRGAVAKCPKMVDRLAGGLSHRCSMCSIITLATMWSSCRHPNNQGCHRLIRRRMGDHRDVLVCHSPSAMRSH